MRKHCLFLFFVSVLFFSCDLLVGLPDRDDDDSALASVRSIRSIMNRSDVERMMFMGGSMLYSPKDSNANQLGKGVIVSVRIGEVEKYDLGNGEYGYRNSKLNYELGFIEIDSISRSEISFSYYKFPSNGSGHYVSAGGFTLEAGNTADLNGDGFADIKYSKPDPGRNGYKENMWLTFLSDVERANSSTMFSVIPIQYSRGVYPNGLLGINPDGQFIINKYDVGTNNRSLVSDVSYGDYVLDTEENTIARFVGGNRSSRSAARSIIDGELEEVEQISSNSTPEEFEFKANEFTDEFNINTLLSIMPSSIVKENYSGRSIAENVDYLNRLIRESSFLERLVAANSGQAVDEIRNELLGAPIAGEVERVLFCRHALALVYPDSCPDVNLFSQTLSNIIPWLYIDFGDVIQQATQEDEEAERTAARSVVRSVSPAPAPVPAPVPTSGRPTNGGLSDGRGQDYEIGDLNLPSWSDNLEIRSYQREAALKHAKERETKVDSYVDYEIKRDAIEKYFSQLYSYNFAPLLATLTGQQWIKDIVKSTKTDLSIGIGGGISFANSNPSVNIKMGVLIKFELENKITFNVSSTSFFADSAPEKKSVRELQEKFNEKFPDGHYSTEEVKDYLDTMSKMDLKDELGLDSWVFDASDKLQKSSYKNGIRPSKDAKATHQRIQPVPALPLVLTIDARFDILFKTAAVVELDNLSVCGIYMTVFDCKAGINWGFRKKYSGIPDPTTFYCNTYASAETISENAGFAGITSRDPKQFKIGGGVKFTIVPTAEFRLGGGIGYDVLGAGADVTLGGKVDFFAPLSAYLGLAYTLLLDPVIILDMDMDAGFSYSGDVQFCLDPPLLSKKYWNYDIPGLKDQKVWQIFRLRLENGEIVKSEGPKLKG